MKINTKIETLKDLKVALKEAAVDIRHKKSKRKGSPYGVVAGLDDLRYEYRHHHIAYCLIRGRSMEEIERNCAIDNRPNSYYVDTIMRPIERYWENLKKGKGLVTNAA